MMVAMMLPCLVPMLARYRESVGRSAPHLGRRTATVGAGYFAVWTAFGIAAFPLGVALAEIEMRQPALARAVPFAVGGIVLVAGILQLTAWKARQLACCREGEVSDTPWLHGVRLGLRCARCCGNLMALLMVLGVMDLGAMAVVTAAITVERVGHAGPRVARAIGALVVVAGLYLLAGAAAGQ